MMNIGVIYSNAQKNQKALDYYKKALFIFKKILGDNNIKVANC